jgi:hypothetical protein
MIVSFDDLPLSALYRTVDEGTDLACELLCGAYIENATGQLLQKVMIDHPRTGQLLNDDNGLLKRSENRLCRFSLQSFESASATCPYLTLFADVSGCQRRCKHRYGDGSRAGRGRGQHSS